MKKTLNTKVTKSIKTRNPTAEDLTNVLWDTLTKVKSKKIKPIEANAIARISREMLGVSKLKLEYAKFTGAKVLNDKLMIENK